MIVAPDSRRDEPGSYTATLVAQFQDFPDIPEYSKTYIFTVTISAVASDD